MNSFKVGFFKDFSPLPASFSHQSKLSLASGKFTRFTPDSQPLTKQRAILLLIASPTYWNIRPFTFQNPSGFRSQENHFNGFRNLPILPKFIKIASQ
jgi:hypothetical protein